MEQLKIPSTANGPLLSYLRLRLAHAAVNNLSVDDRDDILDLFSKSTSIGGAFTLPSISGDPALHILNAAWQISMDTSNFYRIWTAESASAQIWLKQPFGYDANNLQDKTIPELKSLALTALSIAMQGTTLHGFDHLNLEFERFIKNLASSHIKEESTSDMFISEFMQEIQIFQDVIAVVQRLFSTDPLISVIYGIAD